jgi:hypothetical protein
MEGILYVPQERRPAARAALVILFRAIGQDIMEQRAILEGRPAEYFSDKGPEEEEVEVLPHSPGRIAVRAPVLGRGTSSLVIDWQAADYRRHRGLTALKRP